MYRTKCGQMLATLTQAHWNTRHILCRLKFFQQHKFWNSTRSLSSSRFWNLFIPGVPEPTVSERQRLRCARVLQEVQRTWGECQTFGVQSRPFLFLMFYCSLIAQTAAGLCIYSTDGESQQLLLFRTVPPHCTAEVTSILVNGIT